MAVFAGCLTAENVHKISTENACNAIRANITRSQRALLASELDRRGLFAEQPDPQRSTAEIVKDGYIWLGMSEDQLRCTRGLPRRVNRSVGSWGVEKQWVYGKHGGGPYIYTKNGLVTSWQD